ncbi:hypothetical protein LTR95_001646 [Oleoguttula sp. CCFEE 5521]
MAKLSFYTTELQNLASDMLQFTKDNPKVTGLLIIGVPLFMCPQMAAAPALKMFGFTSAGPAAGSLAAQWQGVVGAVPAAGTFASAQSAGMGGYGLSTVNGVVQGIAMVDLMTLLLGKGSLGEKDKGLLKSKL